VCSFNPRAPCSSTIVAMCAAASAALSTAGFTVTNGSTSGRAAPTAQIHSSTARSSLAYSG
jgi:hypothetical protein